MDDSTHGLKPEASILDNEELLALIEKIKYDPITGIYDKYVFLDYMERLLETDKTTDYDIVCLSVEGYNLLLDRYGREKCYSMMRNIATRLTEVLPPDTLIGKIEEAQIAFITKTQPAAVHEASMSACEKLFTSRYISGVSVKVGVYQHIDRKLTPQVICHNALMAAEHIRDKYDAKVGFYDTSLREQLSRERFIIDNMQEALRLHQFIVYYQPKFSVKEEKINGAEALVRWIHPEAGFMNPGDFISIFEHNGFIQELDKYMLEEVCIDIKKWIEDGMKIVPVSINVSQANFDNENLAEDFAEIVDKYDVPHKYIHFEITESVNAKDIEKKIYTLQKIRDKGFSIELDDFGSGYSSMSALCDIPIDYLKLDMSLVQRMFEKKHSAVLSGALFTARELSLNVVAEGIETKEQVEEIKFRGSYIKNLSIQGYYFSKPLPKLQFEHYLMPQDETGDSEDISLVDSEINKSVIIKRADSSNVTNALYDEEIQNKKYRALMEVPGNVIYEYNPRSDIMSLEVQMYDGAISRRSTEKYLERLPDKHWIHENDITTYIEAIRLVANYGEPRSVYAKALTKEGGYRNCKYNFAPMKDEKGEVIRVVGRAEIIDEDVDIYGNNKEVSGTFRCGVDEAHEFKYVSESLVKMLGFDDEMEFRRFYNNTANDFIYEDDREQVLAGSKDEITSSFVNYSEYRVRKKDASIMWVFAKTTVVGDEYGNEYFYVSVTDYDEYKEDNGSRDRSEDAIKLNYKSELRLDKMTGLDNRDYSLRLIKKYLDSEDIGTFFMVDVDDFKAINETRGHVVGDRILCQVADAIHQAFRDGDVIGRFGGDEFVCYMPGVNKKNVAMKKAETIIGKAKYIEVSDTERVNVSIGVVSDISRAANIEDLVDMANKALNDTRKKGKGKYAFY